MNYLNESLSNQKTNKNRVLASIDFRGIDLLAQEISECKKINNYNNMNLENQHSLSVESFIKIKDAEYLSKTCWLVYTKKYRDS